MYLLYSFCLLLGLLAFSPVLLLKDTRNGRYTRFLGERFGFVPPLEREGAIWVHAVSVGETLAAERLLVALKAQYPNRPIVLSVTTAAARAMAERRIGCDRLFYFPLDFRWMCRRTLRAIRPSLILIMETEIWPNFLRETRAQRIDVLFVNGRISGRSFARYRFIRRLLRPALRGVTAFLMQTQTDAERILYMGAAQRQVQVIGNLKFDLVPPENRSLLKLLVTRFRAAGVQEVIVAGSTMEGEEALVLEAFEMLREHYPAALLILAPRHPQRFDEVAGLIQTSGLPLTRRTLLEETEVAAGGVLLLDTVGELASVFKYADAAFIGGSLVPHGGHNILEPAYFGAPIIFGPHMHNFTAIAEEFLDKKAAFRADSVQELAHVWRRLLGDEKLRRQVGEMAQALLASKRGATALVMDMIERRLNASSAKANAGPGN